MVAAFTKQCMGFAVTSLVCSSKVQVAQVPAAVEELVGGKWAQEDVLPLNGTPEEVQQLREHMLLQRAAAKAKKERKKAGKLQAASGDIVAGATCVVPVEYGQAADAAGKHSPLCRGINFTHGKGKV